MTTIYPSKAADIDATLTVGSSGLNISPASTVTAQLFAADGVTSLCAAKALSSAAIGANWSTGNVVAQFDETDTAGAVTPSAVVKFVVSLSGSSRSWSVPVEVGVPDERSALFPSRDIAVAKLRQDRLMLAAANVLEDPSKISDEYLWSKLQAAEASIAGMLGVPLQPTRYFSGQPTDEQIATLPAGMPWEVDAPYDYDPANFQGDRWGFFLTRHRPVISVVGVKFVYPSPTHTVLNVPSDWIRVDRKYGRVQFVPTSSPFLSPIGGLVMNNMASGRMLPQAIELEYTAGLTAAEIRSKYADLLDVVQKQAVTKIIEDSFPAASGSVSADGLSQSMSVDLSKYHDMIDHAINGGPGGSNGGLMVRIHGIRTVVM